MKKSILFLAIIFLFAGCREQAKDFNLVSIGMSKAEVTATAGEPARKTELGIADVWVYPTFDRSVVFRKDTVYNIITSTEARMDSIESTLKNATSTIGEKLERVGDSLERTGEQIGDKFRKDTTEH